MPDRREAILIASTNASRPSKKRILTVCVKLFLEQGYKKTTVAQIVQQASVSNSIFQNIFRAKDGVLTELAQFMFSNQFAMARSTAGTQLPPIYVYAVETAIQMTLTELNENLREIYIEAYTQKEASEYILRETKAPEGYTKAADVSFTVTDDMKLIGQKVTMKDAKKNHKK